MLTLRLSRQLTTAERQELTAARERLAAECASIGKSAKALTKLHASLAEVESEQQSLRDRTATGTDRQAFTDLNAVTQQKAVLSQRIEEGQADFKLAHQEAIYQACNDGVQLVQKVAGNDLDAQLQAMAMDALSPFFTTRADCLGLARDTHARRALGAWLNPMLSGEPLVLVGHAELTVRTIDALLGGEVLFTFPGGNPKTGA